MTSDEQRPSTTNTAFIKNLTIHIEDTATSIVHVIVRSHTLVYSQSGVWDPRAEQMALGGQSNAGERGR